MHEVQVFFFLFLNFFPFLFIFYLSFLGEVDVLIGIAQKTMPAEVDKRIKIVIRDYELRVVLLAQELALIQIILNYYPDGGLTKINKKHEMHLLIKENMKWSHETDAMRCHKWPCLEEPAACVRIATDAARLVDLSNIWRKCFVFVYFCYVRKDPVLEEVVRKIKKGTTGA